MAGMSWLAVPLGVFGCLLITFAPYAVGSSGLSAFGFLLVMIGTLVFLRGNRLKRAQSEERRHREMMEAIAKRDKPA
jgi:hypothetical protein